MTGIKCSHYCSKSITVVVHIVLSMQIQQSNNLSWERLRVDFRTYLLTFPNSCRYCKSSRSWRIRTLMICTSLVYPGDHIHLLVMLKVSNVQLWTSKLNQKSHGVSLSHSTFQTMWSSKSSATLDGSMSSNLTHFLVGEHALINISTGSKQELNAPVLNS